MSNCTNKLKCGECDSPLTTPQPLVLNPECPTPNPCPTVSFTDCVLYSGENATCGDTTIAVQNDNLTTILGNIITYFCESSQNVRYTMQQSKVCGTDTVYEEGDSLETALSKIVDYFCSLIPPQ